MNTTENKHADMAPVYKDWRDALLNAENFLIETTGSFSKANQRLRENNLPAEDDYGCRLTYAEILGALHDVRMALEIELQDMPEPVHSSGGHGGSSEGMMAAPLGGYVRGTGMLLN